MGRELIAPENDIDPYHPTQKCTVCLSLCLPRPRNSVDSVEDLRTGGRWFDPPARQIFFPRIDESHCDWIHSSLTAIHCFDDDYVGEQPMAWEKYCAEYSLKVLKESIDRCTGCRHMAEMVLINKSISQSINQSTLWLFSMIPQLLILYSMNKKKNTLK